MPEPAGGGSAGAGSRAHRGRGAPPGQRRGPQHWVDPWTAETLGEPPGPIQDVATAKTRLAARLTDKRVLIIDPVFLSVVDEIKS